MNLKAHCSCLAFWPSFCLSSESFPGNAFSPCPCSVVCVSAKRFSVPLTQLAQEFESASGITPLLRYYEPLRHPLGRSRLFVHPLRVGSSPPRRAFPGSSTDLSSRAASNHPGDSDRCICSLLPCPCWLHPGRRIGQSRLPNEAVSSSLTLRLMSSPARGFSVSGFPSCCPPATCLTSNYMMNSFRSLDLPDLSWRTDR